MFKDFSKVPTGDIPIIYTDVLQRFLLEFLTRCVVKICQGFLKSSSRRTTGTAPPKIPLGVR